MGGRSNYATSARGAYEAFFDSNIQPDWVHIDNIDEYRAIYLPYPVMLSERTATEVTSGASIRRRAASNSSRKASSTPWPPSARRVGGSSIRP